MVRPSSVIDDPTGASSGRIDIGSRIGWLLRISRMAEKVTLRELVTRLAEHGVKVSVSSLSDLETSGQRNGRMIDAYEAGLDLEAGRLRSVVDIMCRTFDYAPADRAPELVGPGGLQAIDAALEGVERAEASGGDWLRLARDLGDERGGVLPTRIIRPLVERLLSELMRSVGPAYFIRYEAIARLQETDYVVHVHDAVRAMVETPGSQGVTYTAITLASDYPTTALLEWLITLLDSDDETAFGGGALALSNARHVGKLGAEDWAKVVEPFLRAHAAHPAGPRAEALTSLFKNLPTAVRREIKPRLKTPLASVHAPDSWALDEDNAHFVICQDLAARASRRLGLPEQPMLARLLFEGLFDFRSTVTTSSWLLGASAFAPALHGELLGVLDAPLDHVARSGAFRMLMQSATPASDEVVAPWFERLDAARQLETIQFAEQWALEVREEVVAAAYREGEPGRGIVRALGMSGQPDLKRLAEDPDFPPQLRLEAQWWLREGARIVR